MFRKDLVVPNKTGLHARPASGLVRLCKGFESNVRIVYGEKVIDAKNIIQVLASGLSQHAGITLEVEGPDEDTAGVEIANYIETLTE